jgi:hypothetical protein
VRRRRHGDGVECTYPASCAELNPAAADGEYTLYVGGDPTKPWTAYCKDMTGTPKEYLTFQSTENANFSQYTAGGSAVGTDVRTSYEKVRIDPETLKIDPTDRTFATSTGSLTQGVNTTTSMDYALAADCAGTNSAAGVANLDFRGSPFAAAPDQFAIGGFNPGGMTTYRENGRIVDLTGGGDCGWNSTIGTYTMNSTANPIQLVYAP